MGFSFFRTNSLITGGKEWEPSTCSGTQMPVRTVSQKFSHPLWGTFFKELWCRPTTTSDFRSSFWQIHHASNIRLLEDKIQDWGVYLFTVSYGSYAVDQRTGVGWFSGWTQIFVHCKRNSYAEFWSARCEDCFSRIIHNSHFKRRISLEEQKAQKAGPFPPAEDRLLTWSVSTSGSLEPMILWRIMPTYLQLFFKMMIFRNSIRNVTDFFN